MDLACGLLLILPEKIKTEKKERINLNGSKRNKTGKEKQNEKVKKQ
jgi:hypothetical protein